MKIEDFIRETEKLGITCDDSKIEALDIYYEELIKYNTHTNLTAIVEKDQVYLKHFFDSLTINKVVLLTNPKKVLDIGSGAGFPGIVLSIFFPLLKITILDSNNKKTTFLKLIVEKLNLENCEIVNDRAENYAKNHLNEYDLCVSRAVAYVDIILLLSMPFIKENGKVVLMKGNFEEEKNLLEKYKTELGINNYSVLNFKLPICDDERNLVIFNKSNKSKVLNYSHLVKLSKKRRANIFSKEK